MWRGSLAVFDDGGTGGEEGGDVAVLEEGDVAAADEVNDGSGGDVVVPDVDLHGVGGPSAVGVGDGEGEGVGSGEGVVDVDVVAAGEDTAVSQIPVVAEVGGVGGGDVGDGATGFAAGDLDGFGGASDDAVW